MALTPSTMLPLGTVAPDFMLPDAVSGNVLSLQTLKSDKATVILFICNHCPFVKHIQPCLVEVANLYMEKGVSFIAISANDIINYPDDSPQKMKALAEQEGYRFPYLYDESQQIAKAYHAACTPDIYLFDPNLKCCYRGQFDASTPSNGLPVTGNRLSAALDSLLLDRSIDIPQQPSVGCNIKWVDKITDSV